MFFDTLTLFHEFYCSASAAWIIVLSFGVCFKSVASFCHPQCLLRTSPRSMPCAWNSRIWHFHLNSTLSPCSNVWNLDLATSRPELMKLTCQFRRFWARTFSVWPARCISRPSVGGSRLEAVFSFRGSRVDSRLVIQTGSWTGVCKVSRLCHWY